MKSKARHGEKFTSKPGKAKPNESLLERGLSSSESFDPASAAPKGDGALQAPDQHKDVSAPNGTKIRGI